MAKASRDKGAAFERDVVQLARDTYGLDARRTAMNQCFDGSEVFGDVTIAGKRVECKSLKTIPNWCELLSALVRQRPAKLGDTLRRYLKGHDALALKLTGWSELILVVLPDDTVLLLDDWLQSLTADLTSVK